MRCSWGDRLNKVSLEVTDLPIDAMRDHGIVRSLESFHANYVAVFHWILKDLRPVPLGQEPYRITYSNLNQTLKYLNGEPV